MPRSIARHHHAAFTLIELLTAIVSASVVMAGLGASLVIASRAMPSGTDALRETVGAAGVADRVLSDAAHAIAFTRTAPTAIAFEVADRGDADDGPETLEYAWSGTPGEPLTVSIDGAAPISVADDVRWLTFAYDRHPLETGSGDTVVESGTVASFEEPATGRAGLNQGLLTGQTFQPALGAGAVGWSIKRVRLSLERDGGLLSLSSSAVVQLRPVAPDGAPTDEVLAQATVIGANVPTSPEWITVDGLRVEDLDPSGTYAVVLEGGGLDPDAISAGMYDVVTQEPMTAMVFSTDDGATWIRAANLRLRLVIEATIERQPSQAPVVVRGVTLSIGGGQSGRARPLLTSTRVHAFAKEAP